MEFLYRLVKKTYNGIKGKVTKYHAFTVYTGKSTSYDLAGEIQKGTSFTRGDVMGLTISLGEKIVDHLIERESVSMDYFGTFRLVVHSDGVDNPRDFKASDVRGVSIVFTPSQNVKKRLEELYFRRHRAYDSTLPGISGEEDAEADDNGSIADGK